MSSARDSELNSLNQQWHERLSEYLRAFNFDRFEVHLSNAEQVAKIKEAQGLVDTKAPKFIDYDTGYVYAMVAKKIGIYYAYREQNVELANKYFLLSLTQFDPYSTMPEKADTKTMVLFCKIVAGQTDKESLVNAVKEHIKLYQAFAENPASHDVRTLQEYHVIVLGTALLQTLQAFLQHGQSLAATDFDQRLNLEKAAQESLGEAIRALKPRVQEHSRVQADLAEAYCLLGKMHCDLQDYANAEIALRTASLYWEQCNTSTRHIHPSSFYTAQALGMVLRNKGEYEASISLLNTTRSKQIETFGTKYNYNVANTCFLLGETLAADGDAGYAMNEFNEALEILRKLHLPDMIGQIETAIARLQQRPALTADEKPDSPGNQLLARQQQPDAVLAQQRSLLFSQPAINPSTTATKQDSPRPY
jgi:tetratricopeptide (TPR) repeat protein